MGSLDVPGQSHDQHEERRQASEADEDGADETDRLDTHVDFLGEEVT